jgi:hypothetical protein
MNGSRKNNAAKYASDKWQAVVVKDNLGSAPCGQSQPLGGSPRERFIMEKCPFCGLHPFEYVDIGIGQQAVVVNCCEYGYLLYDRCWSYRRVKAYQVYSDVMSWFWSMVHRLTKRASDKGNESENDILF